MKKTLKLVKEFRKADQDTPIVLMGYYNPVYVYGVEKFLKDAKAAGVDGFIIVDLPPEEDRSSASPHWKRASTSSASRRDDGRSPRPHRVPQHLGLCLLRLRCSASPAPRRRPEERQGQRQPPEKHTSLPICVGFGVKTAEQARAIGRTRMAWWWARPRQRGGEEPHKSRKAHLKDGQGRARARFRDRAGREELAAP